MKKNYLFSIVFMAISQIFWGQCSEAPETLNVNGISVNVKDCSGSEITGFFNFSETYNGKNRYVSLIDNNLLISFDGTKWVVHLINNIATTSFENTTVTSDLTPPLTGWTPTGCDAESSMEVKLGVQLCYGSNVNDLINLTENNNDIEFKFYDNDANGAVALEGTTALTSQTYYVTRSNLCGESEKSEFLLTVLPDLNNTVTNNAGVLTASQTGLSYQWFTCTNEKLEGETGQTFTPTENGIYKVHINDGFCMVESACVTVNTLSNEEFNKTSRILVSPNPSSQFVHITSPLNGRVQVINTFGQVVKRVQIKANTKSKINISNLSRGLYFVKVNNTTAKKLIIK